MEHDPMPGGVDIQVRRATRDDWAAIRDLRLRAVQTDPHAFGAVLGTKRFITEEHWKELAASGAEMPDFSTWVAAEPDGSFVGMIVVARGARADDLLALWVEPSHRHTGTGGHLLDRAIAWAREAHPNTMVRLEVNPVQVEAIRLYESRGFRFTGASRPLGFSEGEIVEEMALRPVVVSRE